MTQYLSRYESLDNVVYDRVFEGVFNVTVDTMDTLGFCVDSFAFDFNTGLGFLDLLYASND